MHTPNAHAGGYGFCHVPTSPGMFELDCPTWLPEGSTLERISSFFIGGAPRLRAEEVVHSPGDRFRLQTVAGGVVHVRVGAFVNVLCCGVGVGAFVIVLSCGVGQPRVHAA